MKGTYCRYRRRVVLDIINCGCSETFVFRLEGHTVSVSLKCSQTAFAISDDKPSTSSYEIDMPSECNLSIGSPFRVFKWSLTPIYTGNGLSWLLTCRVHSSVLRGCFTFLNLRSWANVNAGWLGFLVDWHLAFGPSRIMFTNASKVWGIDPLCQFWENDPLATYDSVNISCRTMLAAHISLASLSLEKASNIIVPMSSLKVNNTSLPLLWVVGAGIASISFSFRRVECISWVSSARPSLISLLQHSFLKPESLKTVVCGCPYLEFCISAMRSARTIPWASF